jgi:hypothetical protein
VLDSLDRIYRAWVEVDQTEALPKLSIPVYAKPSKTKAAGQVLTLELNPCPERDALLKGKRFEVAGNTFVGMFEAMGGPGNVPLRPSGSGYTLEAGDLDGAVIVAYSVPKSRDGQKVTANEVAIASGPNSIQIIPDRGQGAHIKCSPDLYDQSLRVRVQYAQAVVTTEDPLGTLTAHLLARQGDSIVYVQLPGCQVSAIARTLSLTCDSSRILRHDISS